MNRIEQMNASIDYIEAHITEEIDLNAAAKVAACSINDYQRMFSFATGTTLSEYIRCRRMSLAAIEVQNSTIRILGLALKYGYQSPDAFTRAFHKQHGITPTAARKSTNQLNLYPRVKLALPALCNSDMAYKIVDNKHFKLLGKKTFINSKKVAHKIGEFHMACEEDGTLEVLSNYNPSSRLYGILNYITETPDAYEYYIANDYITDLTLDGYETLDLYSKLWVVFEVPWLLAQAKEEVKDSNGQEIYIAPPAIEEQLVNLYLEWLHYSGYAETGEPEVQIHYLDDNNIVTRLEHWVPIKKDS